MNLERNMQKFPKEDDLFFFGAHSYYLWKHKFIEYATKEFPEVFNLQISRPGYKKTTVQNCSTKKKKASISIDELWPLDKSNYKKRLEFEKLIHGFVYNISFEKYKEENFVTESSLPPAEFPLFFTTKNSSSLVISNNLINLISTASKIESKCVLLSKRYTNLFINGKFRSRKTRVRYLFSAKFISQVVIAMNLSSKNDLNLFRSELTTGKHFDYIPYILAEEIFPKDINLTGTSLCKKTCYFLNISPKICIGFRTNGDLIKKIIISQKMLKDEKISDSEFNDIQSKFDENISFEVKCNLDYDEENDIVNINFGDEMVIDCWLGHDSVFFSFSNFISSSYILNMFSADDKKELIGCNSFILKRNYCLPPVIKAPCANCSGREPYFLSDSCSGTI